MPEQLTQRMLSARAYDETAMLIGAELVDGCDLESLIPRLFADGRATYLHVHFATFGCYAARIEQA